MTDTELIKSHLKSIRKILDEPVKDDNLKNQFDIFGLTSEDLSYIYKVLSSRTLFMDENEEEENKRVLSVLNDNYIKYLTNEEINQESESVG